MPLTPTPVDFALLGMVLGLLGTLVPLVPGLPIIVLCAVAYYALVTGWTVTATLVVGMMVLLMLVGMTAEWWLAPAGARRGGASCLSTALAGLSAIVGFFVLPVIGAILLPVLVVLAVEWLRARDLRRAGRAATAYFMGWLAASGVELVAGLLMIALFWWAAAR